MYKLYKKNQLVVYCSLFMPKATEKGLYVSKSSTIDRVGHPFFSKECNILAFFPVIYKRTERSLGSFPFFIKEQNDLCVLSHFFYKRTERSLHSFPFFITERNDLSVLLHSLLKNETFFLVS